MSELAFFIDYSRCIGCQACVQACEECDTHRGRSLIHLETIERRDSVQTAPQVCMHCEDPICAQVCPADAIKQTPDGVVQSSLKPRCIGCSNCVLACPFGVPKYDARRGSDDEVRHVLRPHQHRPATDVRHRVPVGRARLHDHRGDHADAPAGTRSTSGSSATSTSERRSSSWCRPRSQHVNVSVIPLNALRPTKRLPADPYDVAALLEAE